ncbi:MAG: sensor histidine kinase [Enterococcus aquimarinus]
MAYYIKTHWIPFTACLTIIAFVALITGLSDTLGWRLSLYFLGLSAFLFLGLFAYDYYTKRHLYRFLSGHTNQLLPGDSSPVSQKIQVSFDHVRKKEEQQLLLQTKRQEQQITFMNLWVHQMKTPLSVLEMMAQNKQLTPSAVLTETQRLKNGLNIALNEARLSAGFQTDFVLKKLSLTHVVSSAVNTQKTAFIQRNIYPAISIPEEMMIISDEKWLAFMIEQLLTNSLKYSYSEGKIDVTAIAHEETIQLMMTDYGVGIPASDLPRVKRPFFTGENGRKFGEATGMGLYLVSQVAEGLDIQLQIDSIFGQGTTVTLVFPKIKQ